MPVMDGMAATRHTREILHLAHLPIIAISAEIGEETRRNQPKPL